MSSRIYKITLEECACSLIDFYDNVARRMGFTDTEPLRYDCRHICVTVEIMKNLARCLVENGLTKEEANTLLLHYGPKASLAGDSYYVEVENGFIINGE